MSVVITPKMECIFSGSAWTDISSDVLRAEPVQAEYGIRGVGPLDLLASTGALSYALGNSECSEAYLSALELLLNPGFESVSSGATLTTNYCLNPSFEVNVTDDWTFYQAGAGSSVNLDATQYKVGAKSCRIRAGNNWSGIYTGGGLACPNGSTATYSCWVRCSADPTGNKVRVGITDSVSQTGYVYATSAGNGAWEYLTVSVTNTSGVSRTFQVQLYIYFNDSAADVWFDACQLELASAATPYCDGTLGWNYSFSGTAHNSTSVRVATNWATWVETVGDGVVDNENSIIHSGAYAAKLIAGATKNTTVAQTFTVIPGTTYGFSFQTRGDGTYGGRIRIYDVSNNADILAAAATGVTGTAYTEVSGTFAAPAGCTSARIDLLCPSTQFGIAYFDDVSALRQLSGVLGKYTPGHANARFGWNIGKKTRLSYAYSGSTFYKTVGYVTATTPTAGQYRDRRVDVSCVDWMDFAGTQKIKRLDIQSAITTGCAVQLVLAQSLIQPRATCIGTSSETFTRAFDSDNDAKMTIAAELGKLARNELGQVFIRGDTTGGETLEFMGRSSRAGGLPTTAWMSSGSTTELEVEYDRENVWNTVRAKTYPKQIDSTACTVAFSLQQPLAVGASATQTFTAHYRDVYSAKPISASAIVYPFRAGTDYNFGSTCGTGVSDKNSSACFSASIGSNSAAIRVENNSATAGYLNDFKLYGKGIYYFDPVEYESRSAPSASLYGERALDMELELHTAQVTGEPLAQYVRAIWDAPRRLIKSVRFLANKSHESALAAMLCEPGTRVYISEEMTAVDGFYDINSVRYETVSDKETWVTWTVVLGDTTEYFRLDHSLLDIDVIAP
jgi:hypothetical protein